MDQAYFPRQYYDWSHNWIVSEWLKDFPLLSSIENPLVRKYLNFIRSLHRDEQNSAITAIQKRFHPRIAEEKPQTDLEQTYISRYIDQAIPVGGSRIRGRLSSKKIASLLQAGFPGSALQIVGGGELVLRTEGKHWDVVTTIEISNAPARIVYHHDISKGNLVFLAQWISILGWSGIAGQTEWMDISDASLAETSLVETVGAFLQSPLVKRL